MAFGRWDGKRSFFTSRDNGIAWFAHGEGMRLRSNSRSGWSCSQAVCSAFAGDFSIDKNAALRLSCGLGGGMGTAGIPAGRFPAR